MSSPPLRIGLLGEPELVVRGLGPLLATADEGAVDLRVVPAATAQHEVDVVLLDPQPPDGRGPASRTAWIAGVAPARVLAWTWRLHPAVVRGTLAAGAHGIVAKSAPAAELLRAMRTVAGGGSVVPPTEPMFPGLSDRQSEVLVLIGQGLSNDEIAATLRVSVNSVKTYIREIYSRTGTSRRTQAVAWAHRHGWSH
ncbi:helix-turn-helix transcriptional regulator [Nocardioides bruguierae]|uniref:Response regulator transcription factor n=1 Tax=Nocardioides bruguierae TaxID=2945102 RepID=A0A9X2IFW8_9ACTN|nr:response regulator transcription factor [Nocardioides bruguierae]MCM0622266.1 response regulator transcription factor [Nocardioides bruguierae]